ncbi:MAG: adenosylcobinamide amidohydrolase [Proteobacteria bacterium]|nr:adenosylcobinamide amidohydrolase [Pseudomonadota bacterium]
MKKIEGINVMINKIKFSILYFISIFVFCTIIPALCYPLDFIDHGGNHINIDKTPSSVVSLVPSVTDIIFKLGAADNLKAVTIYDTSPPEVSKKEVVGGFFSPSVDKIEKINPDVIFYSKLQKNVVERFKNKKCILINLEHDSVSDSFDVIYTLGKIFNKEEKAKKIVEQIKEEFELISKKTSRIPEANKQRVIRLMGRDKIMTPGDDSFQNELIRFAGGIAPVFNKKGKIVDVTKEEWMKFNPQVIYGCGGDTKKVNKIFSEPGWKDVDAVKNGRIYNFPCELTCRASVNSGYFVSWLSARIYGDEFSDASNFVLEEKVFKSKKIDVDLDYIKDVHIDYSKIYDFDNKTLVVEFKKPLSIVSTLEGQRDGIKTVGNHYSPPPCWGIGHNEGFESQRDHVYKVIGKSLEDSSFLFTGADMDNLAVKRKEFKDMVVYALVTAGVKSNAMRMSADEGMFYEPGTINIIILTNMKLTPRAMTRAIISVTEAKSAVMQDLDVRSTYTPMINMATGTGTDNILVVGGSGKELKNAGGHTKLGELIAKAVYAGVSETIYKQNGMISERNIFSRLRDRNLSVFEILSAYGCECSSGESGMVGEFEGLLLQPRYASFLKASFALSDDYEKGLINDLSSYELWCKQVEEEIAGRKISEDKDYLAGIDLPVVIDMALNSLLSGIHERKSGSSE